MTALDLVRGCCATLAVLLSSCTPSLASNSSPQAPTHLAAGGLPRLEIIDREQACSADAIVPPALRLLTALEYQNTVRDLFPGTKLPASAAPQNSRVASDPRGLSPLVLERQVTTAMELGKIAAPRIRQLTGCATLEAQGCVDRFVQEFGMRVVRRPLTQPEHARFVGLYASSRKQWGAEQALQQTVSAILLAPQLIYRFDLVDAEAGTKGGTGSDGRRPDDYALASRLAYFLWQSMPDEELFAVAARGELTRGNGLAKQVERMLRDPKASQSFASFVKNWFDFDRILSETKDPSTFAHWRRESGQSALDESLRFSQLVFESKKPTLTELLLSRRAVVDDAMAAAYGVAATGQWHAVDLDPSQRAGLLTRIAFLAGRAHSVASPPLRGSFVLKRLYCEEPPPPPPNVNSFVPGVNATGKPSTNRHRFELTIRSEVRCAGCHVQMDRFGYAFENYDGAGSYQRMEQGLPIDARVELRGPGSPAMVDGGVELSEHLARSPEVAYCAVATLYRHAYRRAVERGDWCKLDPLYEAFAASGGDWKTALTTIATSSEFRR